MRTILHADLNNFYASVECLNRPDLIGKPVAVCGDPQQRRGVVLAKNELAKANGVVTGEPVWQAQRKCPDLMLVPPHHDRYQAFSKRAKELYLDYTAQVEPFGLDECWLDCSRIASLSGGAGVLADEIRARMYHDLGLTISVGVSFNKIFAKLGSDMKKPNATTLILPEDVERKVWPLPVRELLYVGRATQQKLKRCGIQTIGELAGADPGMLKLALGKNGVMLWQFANGQDLSPVLDADAESDLKSIGNSTTMPQDVTDPEEMKITMMLLCERVAARMRQHGVRCQTVQLYLRDSQLASFERQCKTPFPVCTAKDLFDLAFPLYLQHKGARAYRSVGVRACGLVPEEAMQLSFLPEQRQAEKQERLETAIDRLRAKFGQGSVCRGMMLGMPEQEAPYLKEEQPASFPKI